MNVYFGTFTKGADNGIFMSELDLKTGTLSELQWAGEAVRPGFLAVHPNGKTLYSVGELAGFDGRNADSVCAFEIDAATGMLKALN